MTRFSLAAAVTLSLAVATPANGQDFIDTLYAQSKLVQLGYTDVTVDGRIGPITRRAIEAAAAAEGFEPTVRGLIDHYAAATLAGRSEITDPDLLAAIEEAALRNLIDPFSAHVRDLHRLPSGAICGEVNARNRYGAYVGWAAFWLMEPRSVNGSWFIAGVLMDDADESTVRNKCLLDF